MEHNLMAGRAQNKKTRAPRAVERHSATLPSRLTWRDARGTVRFASVVTRNISELGVYVESPTPISIPLYRLVHLQVERDARDQQVIPDSLRRGRVLSAVYRVSSTENGGVQGLALRLMVEPRNIQGAGRLAQAEDGQAAAHMHAKAVSA